MAKISALNSNTIALLLEYAFSIAMGLDQTTVTTEHLLLSAFQLSSHTRRKFTSNGVEVGQMCKEVLEHIQNNSKYLKNQIPSSDPSLMTGQLTAEVTGLLSSLAGYAKSENRELDLADVLLGLLNLRETYSSYFMNKYGITEDMILQLRNGMSASESAGTGGAASKKQAVGALEEYCENLNEKVKSDNYEPLIGRDKEIYTIAHTLSKRKKRNVLLIGEPGVGKTMILEGLAFRINNGEVPEVLKNKVIYSLDVGNLVAGSKYRGDYEEKITDILEEAASNPDAILFVDEAHQMDAGDGKGQMGLGLSSMIKRYLSRGSLRVAAATTWEGYRQTFEKDSALMRRFRIVHVDEPSKAETIEILKGLRDGNEKYHDVKIEDSAIEASVELTAKYQPEKHFPDKAIDVLDSACARKKVNLDEEKVIDRASIIREITEFTGIKVKSETNDVEASKRILQLEDRLNNVVLHQEKAVGTLSKSMIINQAGLKNPKKPIGSFLFVGPSGVGKTFLAQELANDLNMTFIRFNMSEYMEKHSVAKLIGAPPGYIGFGDGAAGEGLLINDLIKKPNSVVLFDEVEKAHPDVFNIFLQLLDDGEATGGTGKTASAKNCVLVMTSNLGTKESAKGKLGFNTEKTGKSESSKAIDEFFLTELRGRMTAIVEFDNLDDVSYRRIVVDRINDITKYISGRNIKLIATEALISHILELNNSKEYGAREIAKIVENTINYPLGVKLLSGTIENGSTLTLDWVNDELKIEPIEVKVPVEDTIAK